MPPMAGALRRWQVFTRSSAYARMKGASIVTCARSARQKSLFARNFLMHENENVVPEARLEMRLHLRQIEIRARAALEELFCVVEEEECEVEDAAGDRSAVDRDVLFVEVPAAGPGDEHRGAVVELVLPAA